MGKFQKGDLVQVPGTIRGIQEEIVGQRGRVITEVPERTMPSTYGEGDRYDQTAAQGFIAIWGLPVQLQAEQQLLRQPGDPKTLATPNQPAPDNGADG